MNYEEILRKAKADSDDGKEYNADGEEKEGGGYIKKAGKLCKMKMEKSHAGTALTEEDLQKGLDALDEFVSSGDGDTRKEVLLKKALEGDLEADEQQELFSLMGGQADDGADVDDDDDVAKSLEENPTLREAFDVSSFLELQNAELCKALRSLQARIESTERAQNEFNLLLAKSVSDSGKLTKAMSHRLGVIETQPARAPKSQPSGAQPLHKSFAGQPAGEEQLSKSQIFDAMEDMMQKSVSRGDGGRASCGEDIAVASSKFEQFGQISPRMLEEVKQHVSSQRAQ